MRLKRIINMENKITCFLFGEEACQMWYDYIGKGEDFLPMLEDKQISYDIFYFTEGKTPPEELLFASDGWNAWGILPEGVYINHFNSLPEIK